MYEGMDYSVYRRVREYYGSLGIGKGGRDEEDAFGTVTSACCCYVYSHSSLDMRKPLGRDQQRRSVRSGGRELQIHAQEAP
jgi:N-terminal acetyltransferase B complex catalytic subunit